MENRAVTISLLMLATGIACPGYAQNASPTPATVPDPIVTDRPDFTESTEVVPLRRSQLEGGVSYSRAGSESGYALGEFLLRVATGPRAEFRLGLNSYALARAPTGNTAGLEDLSVGMKVKLADGSPTFGLRQPAIALILATSLPTGATAYREKNLQPEAKLCLAWGLSERLQMSSNLNYAYASQGGARFGQFSATLSFGYGLSERVACYAEYFGFVPGERDGANQNFLNGGFTYLVTPDYQLDARAGLGMNSTRPDGFFGLGASRRW